MGQIYICPFFLKQVREILNIYATYFIRMIEQTGKYHVNYIEAKILRYAYECTGN